MISYEFVSVFIDILMLLCNFGCFIVAILAFLERKKKRK